MHRRAVAVVLLAALLCACGYEWMAPASRAARPRVAIEPLRNDSFEPGVEFVVTDALQREFQRRGSVEVVPNPENADFVLGGAVLPLKTHAASLTSVSFAIEYQLTMALALSVIRAGEEVEVDRRSLRKSEFYFASSDVEVQRKNREEALRRVASAIAGRVHDALFEGAAP
ncbi:MAG: LPS assembly lipoprotein LptE [Myxococcota bacterium]